MNIRVIDLKTPDIDAQLIAENIAQQLEKRIAFRRAMKQSIQRAFKADPRNVKGIKIAVAASHAEKCERCWHREESVGHLHEGICDRCSSNVYGDGEVRRFA